MPLPDAAAQKRSPWREIIKTDWPERFSAVTLQARKQFYENLGIFDRERYENSPITSAESDER
jgi:hypothetical protein